MSKYSTILNKKRVDLLVNWNIYVKHSTILNKKRVDLLVNWNIYVETQYNLEQKENRFTCKLEYLCRNTV